MGEKAVIEGVELILTAPDEVDLEWIGGEVYITQLKAAWILVDSKDIPLNPQILGAPGIGKTTLAYSAAKQMGRPVYIFQCTVDTRPEDLLISPVIGENNSIKYHASSLVSAIIKGGIVLLDEANRMSEKSWASLAPLLDQRRYVESIIAGIKIKAHPDFRLCVTMNDDSSTFEIPEYIHSRLQPQIFVEFPERDEELKIIQFNLPFAKPQLIEYVVDFLQQAHKREKPYSVRDGINICRYYLKLLNYTASQENNHHPEKPLDENKVDETIIHQSLRQVLGEEAISFWLQYYRKRGEGSEEDSESDSDDTELPSRLRLDFESRIHRGDFKDRWNAEEEFEDEEESPDDDEFDENEFGPEDFNDREFEDDDFPEFSKEDDVLHIVEREHKNPNKRKKYDPLNDFDKRDKNPDSKQEKSGNDPINEFLNRQKSQKRKKNEK